MTKFQSQNGLILTDENVVIDGTTRTFQSQNGLILTDIKLQFEC